MLLGQNQRKSKYCEILQQERITSNRNHQDRYWGGEIWAGWLRRAKVSTSEGCNDIWKRDQIWVKKTTPLISFATLHIDVTFLNLRGCGEELEMKCGSSASRTIMHERAWRACHMQTLMLWVCSGAPRGAAFLTISQGCWCTWCMDHTWEVGYKSLCTEPRT